MHSTLIIVIDQWLEDDMKAPHKQRHTAKRVYDRPVAEYPEEIGVRPGKYKDRLTEVTKVRREILEAFGIDPTA